MKILLYTFLACLMMGCASNTTEEKVDDTVKTPKNEPRTLSPQIIPQNRSVIDLLQNSDSVVVISHEGIWGTLDDSLKAIREKVALTPAQRTLFIETLSTSVEVTEDKLKESCFYPHHRIYFYTKDGLAWWWICFDCSIQKSNGLLFVGVKYNDISRKSLLINLFKKFGLTYQL